MRLLCLFFRNLAFGFLATLAFSLSAQAERCSIEGHQTELSDFYEAAIKKSLGTLPKKAGFAMNPDSLELKTEYTTISDDEYLPLPELEISGSFLSEKGTEFDLLFHSDEIWITYNGESTTVSNSEGDVAFEASLSSKGRDREGNAIHPRCHLSTKAWFTIRNHANGRIITRFELPSGLTINTEEQ